MTWPVLDHDGNYYFEKYPGFHGIGSFFVAWLRFSKRSEGLEHAG